MQKVSHFYVTAYYHLDFKNFSLHFNALFTFPSQYLCTIGFKKCLVYEGGSSMFSFRLLLLHNNYSLKTGL